jgi:uncharacterized repeat protein (TIGR01451 family)
MRRLFEFSMQAFQRLNTRLAAGVVAAAIGGVAVWQGMGYMRGTPKGPTKQVTTGVDQVAAAGAAVQPALASLSDDQLPGAAGGNHQLTQYGQAEISSNAAVPQTNPYLPTGSDPAGGYSASLGAASRYGAASPYSPSSDPAQTAAVPSDPTSPSAAAEAPPTNPYRENATPIADATASASGPPGYAPLSQSPYAGAAASPREYVSPASEAPSPTTPPNDLTPTAAAASSYGNSYGTQARSASEGSGGGYAQSSNNLQPPNALPSNTLPPSGLSASPYAASSQPMQSVGPNAASSPYAGPLPKSESGGRLAAPTPGERHLEGPQQPSIALEKVSPSEIQVGKPATFELYVRNAGQVPAQGVVVTDHVPAGTQLVDARPQPQQAADGSLVWNLGTMQPGDEAQITLQVMPQSEGEIGSTAHVSFVATATSRSICTRPQLAIEHSAPPKVLIGEPLTVGITVSNPGTGPATGVIIEEDVPDGLAHVAGAQLEYEVGTLRPGELKRLELSLRADKAGVVQNKIKVRGDANLAAQHVAQIEIVAPQLQVAVEGPKRRFLERQATYVLQVANPGTAAARDVELVALLPRGMKFISTDSQGQYDPTQHAVFWSLAELPPAKAGAVKLTALPVEPGDQKLMVEGRAALGLTAANEQIVHVEQAAELVHTVKDLDEVIEVGSETTYEVRVMNQGTKAATNVRVAALMPAGMAAVNGEGPTRAGGDATQVIFEPLARLNPQEEVIYKVQVQGKQPGDHIVRVQVSSDEWQTPVTREESTRVYQDR